MRTQQDSPQLVVVMPSYNNEAYCFDSLSSIAKQTYPHFRLIYVNDASTDGTKELVELLLDSLGLQEKVTLIHNPVRKGSLANYYAVIHTLRPKDVVICVDGDDRLAHAGVLERIAQEYQDPDVWLTYGNYVTDPEDPERKLASRPYPAWVIENGAYGAFRDELFFAGHLKTFYARLFQKIKKEDLVWKKGEFLPACGDMAFMFPMLEMACKGHFRFIDAILYVYNINNPECDHKVRKDLLFETGAYVRSLKPYEALNEL